jgi:hypothetical protein
MGFSDSHHFRKMVAGVCMVLGPLCALVAFIVSPAMHTKVAAQMASIAAHPDRTLISTLLSIAAVGLVIVATLGLMHMLRERMVGYGHAGGAMALVGLLLAMASFGAGMLMWAMVKDGVQASDITAVHKLTHAGASMIPLYILPWLSAVGYIVLAYGLYAAKAVDWWMAAAIAVGMVLINLSGPTASIALGIVGSAIFLVGLGSVGTMVLRESDADWEHTPEYHGFRPAAGIS